MLVNVRLEGSDLHWIVTQKSVRIGRGADCDIPVPAERFPMVSREHVILHIENGQIRFTDSNSANGSFVNGNRVSASRLVSGDVLQLGHNGPKLIIEVDSAATASVAGASTMVSPVGAPPASPAAGAPTMIGFGPGGPAGLGPSQVQETSVEDLGSILDERPEKPGASPAASAATDVRPSMASANASEAEGDAANVPTVIGAQSWQSPESSPTISVPGFEAMPGYGVEDAAHDHPDQAAEVAGEEHQEVVNDESAVEESTATTGEHTAAATETGLSAEEEQMIERKLDAMKNLVMGMTALVVVLLCLAFYQNQQIDKNIKAVDSLRQQAEGAVSTFTPALDQRLNALDKRLDSVDTKMKAAEDRMVNRMNQEIPVMLDKYVNRKMDEINKQANTMQPR